MTDPGPTTSGVSTLYYKDAIEQCHSFNSRLMTERRVRLPYLDSQTGVAQNNCNLLFERWQRGPGLGPNQIYTYSSKRWKKKPRSAPLLDTPFAPSSTSTSKKTLNGPISAVENHTINENSNSSSSQPVEYDAVSDIQDAGAEENGDEDDDYYDEDSRHRKRGRKPRARGGRITRRVEKDEEKDKPYPCAYCGKRYKNKPGLNYHLQRYHPDEIDADDDYTPRNGTSTPSVVDQDSNPGVSTKSTLPSSSRSGSVAGSNIGDDLEEEERPTRRRSKKQAVNSAYCDFCLGGADENKKTGESEELVSCSDCGRSGHPTCLQFTDIMTMNVKKYKWQCIECKSCHLCGTSDNDDQLLFCDDCDRGYHMYCLTPPMDEPPEGSWICNLCEADRKVREAQANGPSTSRKS